MDFEKLLEGWLNHPSTYREPDPQKVQELLMAAQAWDGTDMEMVDALHTVLTRHTKMTRGEVSAFLAELRMRLEFGAVPRTYQEFVGAWCGKNGIGLTLDRQLTMAGDDDDDSVVFNRLLLKGGETGVFRNKDQLKAAWMVWKAEEEKARKSEFIGRIAFDPLLDGSVWDTLIEALVREDHQDPDHTDYRRLCKVILQAAIWRIKNKVSGRPTKQHIMPYLRGPQGSGKSTILQWLFEPVADAVSWATFELFDHDEKQNLLRSSPIIVFDEMAKAEKTDQAKLKNLMTATTTMFRRLYGEASKGRVISTFFGCGNLDLSEILFDTTGLRRFFQIEVRKDLWKVEDRYRGIDPLSLWRSVDENAACPLENAEVLALLMTRQQDQKVVSPVEEWLADVVDARRYTKPTSIKELFEAYRDWADSRYPHDRRTYRSFGIELGRILRDGEWSFKATRNTNSRCRHLRYQFPVESASVIEFASASSGDAPTTEPSVSSCDVIPTGELVRRRLEAMVKREVI